LNFSIWHYPCNNKVEKIEIMKNIIKKVYGGSAKDYAPGQVKKRSGY